MDGLMCDDLKIFSETDNKCGYCTIKKITVTDFSVIHKLEVFFY